MSFLSNPFTVNIDDLQIILGPNTSLTEQETEENDLDESYNSANCFNIFTHKIKFTLDSRKKKAKPKLKQSAAGCPEDSSMSTYIKNILKNVKLSLNRVHIRYEDDFFTQSPYAFGLLCDQITSYGSETEWCFGSLESNQFRRTKPT